ncbi:MAG TPA: hypothetical protein VFQ41_13290 [Candidatus Angelobacter sp.]|nr:hypothetical protein [Candidatus Angelobacter sp.]
MKNSVFFLAAIFLGVSCIGCGGSPQNSCNITAIVTPLSAISDHLAAPPNNQVQFSTSSTVSGNCPLIADTLGTWSTSDPGNTSIDSTGLAKCLGATTTPATISNSGTVRGRKFTSATLTCR